MSAYETHITLQDSGRLELHNLPFPAGQRVKVMVTTEEGTYWRGLN